MSNPHGQAYIAANSASHPAKIKYVKAPVFVNTASHYSIFNDSTLPNALQPLFRKIFLKNRNDFSFPA
jgi:hypothetical protein